MAYKKQREVAETVFNRNQRREAEINEALKQEAARRAAVVITCTGCEPCGWLRIKRPKLNSGRARPQQTYPTWWQDDNGTRRASA
jgi:arginyl-tRNA--protein-N-Asp/Glu arginylyltransferase